MPNVASEARVAERFAAWLSQVTGRKHTVSPGGDPPDFIMEPEGWLEVSGIYLRDEQAKFLNCAAERSFGFSGPLDETALRLIRKLDEKLGKQSYQAAYTQRGKGTLLLSCQDCFFDGVNLARIREAFASFRPTNDRGFFKTAYFEYQLSGEELVYEVVYPKKALPMRRHRAHSGDALELAHFPKGATHALNLLQRFLPLRYRVIQLAVNAAHHPALFFSR